jgi:hypothetical protein
MTDVAPSQEPKPKSRGWFVVLAWITLVLFGIFVAGITIVTATIPQIKKAREAGR